MGSTLVSQKMIDVFIKIKGTQGLDGDTDVIEFATAGTLDIKDGEYVLCYDEGEMLGVKTVRTTLTVKSCDTVIMERSGDMSSRLVIEKGARNNCFYNTPYGSLMIGIFGESVSSSLSMLGGKVEMNYTIDSNLQTVSRNIVEITVEVAKEENN